MNESWTIPTHTLKNGIRASPVLNYGLKMNKHKIDERLSDLVRNIGGTVGRMI